MGRRRNPLGSSRARRIGATVGLLAAMSMILGACDLTQITAINDLRSAAGRPQLATSPVLTAAARAHSIAMCQAGAVSASPAGSYDQETSGGVHELVGAGTLDQSISPQARDAAATAEIRAGWKDDPALVDSSYTDMGVASVACAADNKEYMTAVLRRPMTMPATGLYSSVQYDDSQIQVYDGIQYTTAPDADGVVRPLLLNLYVPPGAVASPRATVIETHGGAFVGGDRSLNDSIEWAKRGFVGVSIDYRLTRPDANGGVNQIAAAAGATLDTQQSVRWLRANAATYGIDPTRIAIVGNSAGGALALGAAVTGDATTTGPLAGYSARIQAAVATGAYLTPALPLLHLTGTEAPSMMFQYQMDDATHVTSAYAFQTCDALRAAGSTCDEVELAGTGHTAWLVPGGPWWATKLGPFIWTHLQLGS